MIPFSNHGAIKDISEEWVVYGAELTFTTGGTYQVFTHNHSSNRRFIPLNIGTYLLVTTGATLSITFGKTASGYNDWSTAATIGTVANTWTNRVLANPSSTRLSLAPGEIMRTVVSYSLGSGTILLRVYVAGVLV